MRLSQSIHGSILSNSIDSLADPCSSSAPSDTVLPTNGHTNGLSHLAATTNGATKHGKARVATVNLPGSMLYPDSIIKREEFVRLVVQTLRDVGYIESAATLEAESGYELETQTASQFRQYILEGMWPEAEEALKHLSVDEEDHLHDARFLIKEQKYLELLEAKKTTTALRVLRNELAPMNIEGEHLRTLSSLIVCSEPEELRRRAQWDGASGNSRRQLLDNLHRYIPPSIMIPARRLPTLLDQALSHQQHHCLYHNTRLDASSYSMLYDHQCGKSGFPNVTTSILDVHKGEVWQLEWSHDGRFLASAGEDKMAIIWKMGSTIDSSSPQDWTAHSIIKDHPYPVGALAWSMDDTILVTAAEHQIKLFNAKTGVCMRSLSQHTETVSAISWLPDGSGFFSGAMDRKIMHWDANGSLVEEWAPTAIRITGLSVTPDGRQIVAIGLEHMYSLGSEGTLRGADGAATGGDIQAGSRSGHRLIVFDVQTKQTVWSTRLEGEMTSVKVSKDSQFALINHAPEVLYLYDLKSGRLVNKYVGQQQGQHIIRSCFGGANETFIVSGSEDGNVYVWHRESGTLLEVLPGHGQGSVNSVAWHPHNDRLFASCSDDHTIRIWEAPPPEVSEVPSPQHLDVTAIANGKGKGKSRVSNWEDNVDNITEVSRM